jgi:hypothetical protein
MTDEKHRQMLRRQVQQIRTQMLGILDWIESELDDSGPTQHRHPLPMGTMADTVELAYPEEQEPLTNHHYWILTQLGQGVKLTRKQVMEEFGYSVRHTKRILAVLRKRSLIEFQRAPKPGHYVVCNRNGNRKYAPVQ